MSFPDAPPIPDRISAGDDISGPEIRDIPLSAIFPASTSVIDSVDLHPDPANQPSNRIDMETVCFGFKFMATV
jgi:hypothetical protein